MNLHRWARCVAVQVCLLVPLSIAIRPPYPSGSSRHPDGGRQTSTGEWGQWGQWSTCSAKCGTGIASRTRRCEHPLNIPVASLILRADDSVECDGNGREIKVCNRHRCPPHVMNIRQSLCKKFNARVFNGRKYEWEPFINPNNKCELTCRAKGQHFYARLAERVGDGTQCGLTSLAVCIHRKCMDVGCDGVVGSNVKLDKCGVCKGDNSTCRTISGVFTRPDLPHGYNKIITIPSGSTNINITELRKSTNYLSFRTGNNSIINGNWKISSSGDYNAAGTTFTYKKKSKDCPGECIFAQGPTNNSVDLMVLVYHKNPGVMYSFNVPVDVTETYFKDLISHSENKHTQAIEQPTQSPEVSTISGEETIHSESISLGVTQQPTDSETFREELVENSQHQNPDYNVEEGVQKRPGNVAPEAEPDATYGDRGYTFHEGKGQTVVLKANAGAWLHRSLSAERQKEEAPSFVMSELSTGGEDDDNDEEDDSDEIEQGVELENEDSEEESEEGDEDEEDFSKEDSSEEDDSLEEDDLLEEDSSEEEDSEEEKDIEEGIKDATTAQTNISEDGFEGEGHDEEEEEQDKDGDKDDDAGDESLETETEEVSQPTIDDSRGNEVLGLGDGFREQEPVYNVGGFKLQSRVDEDSKPDIDDASDSHLMESVPETTSLEPTTVVFTTPIASPVNAPQRDSRFRTYGRTLGQSNVQPSIRKVGRPFVRHGGRRNVRIPKYSQSFTFRDRFRALVSAQRKRAYRKRQQQQQANVDLSQTTRAPVVNRHQTTRNQQVQRGQHDIRRIHQQQANNRGVSHRTRLQTHRERQGQTTPTRTHHHRHRHHHHNTHRTEPLVTTGATPRHIPITEGRSSQGLHLGSSSDRQPTQQQPPRQQTNSGSSITLQANINNNGRDSRISERRENVDRRRPVQSQSRDHRLSTGYRSQGNRESQIQSSVGRQAPTNRRQNFDRAIDPRAPNTRPPPSRQPTDGRVVDHRTIVDETLPLGQFDREFDRKDRRIVIPRQPVQGASTGRRIIHHQPVVNPVPRYDSSSNGGEPLTTYAGGVDPVSGLPVVSSASSDTSALTAGRSFTRNVVPVDNSLVSPVSSAGGLSNEILGSNYVWRVSGFSDCTMTCGGGVQQTVVVCVDTRTQAVVTDENCVRLQRPAPTAVTCNTRPCQATWEASPWGSCSTTCGQGIRTRTVTCKSRVSATLNLTMPGDSCSQEKPATREACQVTACYIWATGNWSKCSVNCGTGNRRRDVSCTDSQGTPVTSQLCPDTKPAIQEDCDMGSCGKGWYFTDWPTECPTSCGEGQMQRQVLCAGHDGNPTDDSRCDQLDKPTTQKTCTVDTPCGGNWFTGEWSKCNGTCGYAVKSRDVVCVKNLPGGILAVVTDGNCKGKVKPETGSLCELPECQSEWYQTSWSQCSKSCGTGFRTRDVKCLDPNQQPSGDCPPGSKPRLRDPCNTQACTTRPRPTSAPDGGPCKDSFSQCQLVKKARLCRYGYYAKMCCLSCSQAT